MAKYVTKAQLRQLYQAQLIDNDEYLRLLKEFAGIESRPTTEYNHYDENGEFIGSSVDTDLSDLLDEAGVEVRDDMTDYISREAALEDFESCNAENPNWTPQRVKTLLLRQRTADAAPIVYGVWLEEDGMQICSNCGEEHEWDDYRASYCEDCGAKMRRMNDA